MASATAINKRGLGAWDWEAIGNTANDVLDIGAKAAGTIQSFKQPSVPAAYIPPPAATGMMDPMTVNATAKPGMSTGAKVAIGVAGVALVGGIVYAVTSKKRKKKS